jgi:hypothetical protein
MKLPIVTSLHTMRLPILTLLLNKVSDNVSQSKTANIYIPILSMFE